jgi:Domain of unknown function (DUF4350)
VNKRFLLVTGIVLATFLYGLLHLFHLRFQAGDVYPEYSSLRADPLGTRALWESLGRLMPARRNYRSLDHLAGGGGAALLILGADAEHVRLTKPEYQAIESFSRDGGRLILSLRPPALSELGSLLLGPSGARSGPRNGPPFEDETGPPGAWWQSIAKEWGLHFQIAKLPRDKNGVIQPESAFLKSSALESNLPLVIPCHSSRYFTNLDETWQVIYARTNDRAVIVERPWGAGSMVLCADTFLFSNEALVLNRQTPLLAWMIGPSRRVIFDETHLGVRENPGIATLARQYGLQGLFSALLVLAGLFIWKQAVPFLPPFSTSESRAASTVVTGEEASAGFVNLLRRNVPPSEIMKVCVEQWNAHVAQPSRLSQDRLSRMQALIDEENQRPLRQRNPVRLYREFAGILSKKAVFPAAGAPPQPVPTPPSPSPSPDS